MTWFRQDVHWLLDSQLLTPLLSVVVHCSHVRVMALYSGHLRPVQSNKCMLHVDAIIWLAAIFLRLVRRAMRKPNSMCPSCLRRASTAAV